MRARLAVVALLAVVAAVPWFAQRTYELPVTVEPRRIVLVFDTGGSSAKALERARRGALASLAASGSRDLFAVATIGRQGVRVVVPFTTASLALQRAVAWKDERQPSGDKLIGQLGRLAERIEPLCGVKHVVLFSERTGLADARHIETVTRMHERYRGAGAVLHAVDIRPASVPEGLAIHASLSGEQTVTQRPSEFLGLLALETGGTVASTLDPLARSLQAAPASPWQRICTSSVALTEAQNISTISAVQLQ